MYVIFDLVYVFDIGMYVWNMDGFYCCYVVVIGCVYCECEVCVEVWLGFE